MAKLTWGITYLLEAFVSALVYSSSTWIIANGNPVHDFFFSFLLAYVGSAVPGDNKVPLLV